MHQVALAAAGLSQLVEPGAYGLVVALPLEGLEALELLALRARVELEDLGVVDLLGHVAIDPHDDVLLEPVALVVPEGGLLDLGADELERLHRAAERVDALDQLERTGLDLVGQRLDEVGARERVDRVRDARLVRQDLLRAQRYPRGALGRQRERLVEAIRVQRLRAPAGRGEGL